MESKTIRFKDLEDDMKVRVSLPWWSPTFYPSTVSKYENGFSIDINRKIQQQEYSIFVENQEDLDKFYKDYPEQFLELMENHSIYSYMNNVIAVSIESIAENVKNMIELELVEYVNSDSQNSIFILVEIIRMLRSSMILNSLLTKEELMSDIGGDENFSAYARFELTRIIGKKGEINYITKES